MPEQPDTEPALFRSGPARGHRGHAAGPDRSRLAAILVAEIARNFRVRQTGILAPGRTVAREALARHVAMYLAHVVFGWTYADIAVRFGRHRTCVNYACARIEDRRDDARFDARILKIERRIAAARGAAGDAA